MNIKDIHSRELGPYYISPRLDKIVGIRERQILECRTCCHFPHKLNKDLDEYLNDDCVTYSSKIHGQFTYNFKTNEIVM